MVSSKDPVKQLVNIIIIIVYVAKVILLGCSLFVPWGQVRDLWVKVNMFQFLTKAFKNIKRIYEITLMKDPLLEEIKKQDAEKALKDQQEKERIALENKKWEEDNPDYELLTEDNSEDEFGEDPIKKEEIIPFSPEIDDLEMNLALQFVDNLIILHNF